MPEQFIHDLLIILAAGLLAGIVCRRLRISVLIGYLLVGVVVGKGCFGWVHGDEHEVEYIAEAGVFLLLFSIGLEFSLDELMRLGKNLIIGGGVQMLLVAVPVVAILWANSVAWQPAVLIAAAAAFSSTVLVFKALSEWGHSSLPHGRRAIGILLFQDAALIPLLLLVPLLTGAGEAAEPLQYLTLAGVSILFVVGVILLRYLLAKWIIPWFAGYRTPDLVILFTLVSLGGVTFAAHSVGLPAAIGAFAAGLIFSGNRWSRQIDALVLPFRETFAAVFFVSLGLLFDPAVIWNEPLLMFAFLVGAVALKATAAIVALRLTGLRWKAAAGMGVGLAHIGEFAFVLVSLGWEAAIISEVEYQRVIAIGIGTLILTPMLLKKGLRWTESTDGAADSIAESHVEWAGQQAIVVGAGPIGRQVSSRLETAGRDVCLVDLSQINLHPFAQQGFRTVAGNAAHRRVLELARVGEANMLVICLPDDEAAVQTVRRARSINARCYILVRCRYEANTQRLINAGANHAVSEEVQVSAALLEKLDDFD